MGGLLDWLISKTKVGQAAVSVQGWLSGKKTYFAGAALIVPAVATMVTKYSEQGVGYALHIAGTPEWQAFMAGLGLMGLRAAVTKAADPTKDPNAGSPQ